MSEDEHPPLKRDESLQLFSRDHFLGLKTANRLIKSADADNNEKINAAAYLHQNWDAEIADHFREEEELLIPLMLEAEIKKTLREHGSIRHLVAADRQRHATDPPPAKWCVALGRELHDHIRWEERELFGAIQERATPTQLAAVGKATAEIEKRRPGLRIRGSGPRKHTDNK